MNDEQKAYLTVAKNYINYLDTEGLEILNEKDIDNEIDYSLIEAHHQIIADILRYINQNIFNNNEEKTLEWMNKELNIDTYSNFYCMNFESYSFI